MNLCTPKEIATAILNSLNPIEASFSTTILSNMSKDPDFQNNLISLALLQGNLVEIFALQSMHSELKQETDQKMRVSILVKLMDLLRSKVRQNETDQSQIYKTLLQPNLIQLIKINWRKSTENILKYIVELLFRWRKNINWLIRAASEIQCSFFHQQFSLNSITPAISMTLLNGLLRGLLHSNRQKNSRILQEIGIDFIPSITKYCSQALTENQASSIIEFGSLFVQAWKICFLRQIHENPGCMSYLLSLKYLFSLYECLKDNEELSESYYAFVLLLTGVCKAQEGVQYDIMWTEKMVKVDQIWEGYGNQLLYSKVQQMKTYHRLKSRLQLKFILIVMHQRIDWLIEQGMLLIQLKQNIFQILRQQCTQNQEQQVSQMQKQLRNLCIHEQKMFWPLKTLAVKLWIELCKKQEKFGRKKEEKKRQCAQYKRSLKQILTKTKMQKKVRVYGFYLISKIYKENIYLINHQIEQKIINSLESTLTELQKYLQSQNTSEICAALEIIGSLILDFDIKQSKFLQIDTPIILKQYIFPKITSQSPTIRKKIWEILNTCTKFLITLSPSNSEFVSILFESFLKQTDSGVEEVALLGLSQLIKNQKFFQLTKNEIGQILVRYTKFICCYFTVPGIQEVITAFQVFMKAHRKNLFARDEIPQIFEALLAKNFSDSEESEFGHIYLSQLLKYIISLCQNNKIEQTLRPQFLKIFQIFTISFIKTTKEKQIYESHFLENSAQLFQNYISAIQHEQLPHIEIYTLLFFAVSNHCQDSSQFYNKCLCPNFKVSAQLALTYYHHNNQATQFQSMNLMKIYSAFKLMSSFIISVPMVNKKIGQYKNEEERMKIYNSSESRQYRYNKLLKEHIIEESYSESMRFENLFFRAMTNFYQNFMRTMEKYHSREKIQEIISINLGNYLEIDNLSQSRFHTNTPNLAYNQIAEINTMLLETATNYCYQYKNLMHSSTICSIWRACSSAFSVLFCNPIQLSENQSMIYLQEIIGMLIWEAPDLMFSLLQTDQLNFDRVMELVLLEDSMQQAEDGRMNYFARSYCSYIYTIIKIGCLCSIITSQFIKQNSSFASAFLDKIFQSLRSHFSQFSILKEQLLFDQQGSYLDEDDSDDDSEDLKQNKIQKCSYPYTITSIDIGQLLQKSLLKFLEQNQFEMRYGKMLESLVGDIEDLSRFSMQEEEQLFF